MIKKLAVLISGEGSNLQAIINACKSGELPAEICVVASNKLEARGLERAKMENIPTLIHLPLSHQERSQYDKLLAEALQKFQPDWIILAGWMRILSKSFLDVFAQRVVNLHPALPHVFPGTNAIKRAWIAFQEKKIDHTGIMVHLVPDEGVDSGPVLAQEIVPIYPEDTLETLTARMHQTEHRILIHTLQKLVTS